MSNTYSEKTVAAISTPSGSGGIGIVRISGTDAIHIADKVFRSHSGARLSEKSGYTALYGKVFNNDEPVDEAVALLFRAPKSYTGEDVVELSVHGGNYVVKEVLRAVLDNGASLADGGEFTRRAYMNGKLDLIEAEAVMGIISANGEKSRRAALSLHDGAASNKINTVRDNLLSCAAGLAVFSDYPDDELPEFSTDTLHTELYAARDELKSLISTYDTGKILREGIDTVIAGKPNVGKSTLMNLLSGCRRSIVTPIAGTTRDIVEDTVVLGDVMLHLSDTAGLRATNDEIEKLGVELSREKIQSAGLIIAVFDNSTAADTEDLELISLCRARPSVAIINKSDLKAQFCEDLLDGIPHITVSAENSDCLMQITDLIEKVCGISDFTGNEILLCSERQRECARNALKFTEEAITAIDTGVTLDAVGICIDDAISCLLELTGERVTNAVVDEIFSKFCVGK